MGKIAFLFAGQGAQIPGMGRDLSLHSLAAARVFDIADAMRPGLKDLCFFGAKEALNVTVNTQPCLFAVDFAAAAALNENGVFADGAAGFSLGEIPALAHCGMLAPEEAFDLVCFRADAMQRCSEKNRGGMAAVLKLPADVVENICESIADTFPVNYNCPGQTVAAFSDAKEEALANAVAAAGGRFMKIAVSGAFHSPFMDAASDAIRDYLTGILFNEPGIPLYSNRTAEPYGDPKTLIAEQVNHPVRWQETIERMIAAGFDTFIECGAGKTLSGLVRKIDGNARVFQVSDAASLTDTIGGIRNDA